MSIRLEKRVSLDVFEKRILYIDMYSEPGGRKLFKKCVPIWKDGSVKKIRILRKVIA